MLELNKTYNMDCLKGMQFIPDDSIDIIVTDPPYKLTQKGSMGTMSGNWASDMKRRGKVFEHDTIDIEEYLPEFYRILKPNSHCYIMCNNINLPHFFDVISKSGFHFVKLLVWDKETKICGTYYMGQVEHIFFLRKGAGKPINDCGVSDLLSFPNIKEKNADGTNLHNSQKPVGLMQTLIKCSSLEDEIVLDPFMGSGTTAVAAASCKRRFIGFELDAEYCRISNERAGIELHSSERKLF